MPSERPKMVLIGAGSRTFAARILGDFYGSKTLAGARLVLVDIDEAALNRTRAFVERLQEEATISYRLDYTTDRRQALPGADFVIVSIAIRRMALWQQDYLEPLCLGFNHCYGENAGPGALFHTLRNLSPMMAIVRDMEEICPDAWLINFTNPENRLCLAIHRHSSINTIGLCHGINGTLNMLARFLQIPRQQIDARVGGVNHLTWMVKLWHRETGEDLIPRFKERVERVGPPAGYALCCALMEHFDCFPTTGDSHVGEFFAFGREYFTQGFDYQAFEASHRRAEARLNDFVEGHLSAAEWLARPSGEIAIPVMEHLYGGKTGRLMSVIVPNQGAIANLPESSVIETAGLFANGTVQGESIGPLPAPAAAATRRELDIQELIVEAWAKNSRKAALQALLLDPNVNSLHRAELLLDRMLTLQKDYLPPLV